MPTGDLPLPRLWTQASASSSSSTQHPTSIVNRISADRPRPCPPRLPSQKEPPWNLVCSVSLLHSRSRAAALVQTRRWISPPFLPPLLLLDFSLCKRPLLSGPAADSRGSSLAPTSPPLSWPWRSGSVEQELFVLGWSLLPVAANLGHRRAPFEESPPASFSSRPGP